MELNMVITLSACAILLWAIYTYNAFIRDNNLIKEAWSGIDVQLKRRHNLVPNLVAVVQAYSKHEKNLLQSISEKRTEALKCENIDQKSPSESDLSGMLKNLLIVVEAYPNLKAEKQFQNLHNQLVEIEGQLQYARRYYNGAVRNYNIRAESFPAIIVARIFSFKRESFFEITLATERHSPKIAL